MIAGWIFLVAIIAAVILTMITEGCIHHRRERISRDPKTMKLVDDLAWANPVPKQ